MKKNIFKIIVFAIISIIIARVLSIIYLERESSTLIYSKFYNVPDEIEIANFGSSHGNEAFYYDDFGMTGFNFALSSQSVQYDKKNY